MSGKPWTAAEIEFLRRHYPVQGGVPVAAFTGRSLPAIQQMARRLGIQSGLVWTAEDIAVLQAQYPAHGPNHVAALIGRTPDAVRFKAKTLGIRWHRDKANRDEALSRQPKHDADTQRHEIARTLAAFRAASPAERALILRMAEDRRAMT